MIVEANVVSAELFSFAIREVSLADRRYFCPSVVWLDEFSEWLGKRRKKYIAERFDCDNFARWAAAKADEAIYERDDLGECAHTFGELSLFLKDNGILGIVPPEVPGLGRFGGHATNIVRCNDSKWYLFEPQTGRYATLDSLGHGIAALHLVRL